MCGHETDGAGVPPLTLEEAEVLSYAGEGDDLLDAPEVLVDPALPTNAPGALPFDWNTKFYFWCPMHLKHLVAGDSKPQFYDDNDDIFDRPVWVIDLSFVDCPVAHEADDHSCMEHWEIWADKVRDA
jgi:hypothetical protein